MYLCDTRYLPLCLDDCLVCRVERNSTLHTRQSSKLSDKYQVSHRYSYFFLLWAYSRPKHVQKRNTQAKKNFAPSWIYLYEGKIQSENKTTMTHSYME